MATRHRELGWCSAPCHVEEGSSRPLIASIASGSSDLSWNTWNASESLVQIRGEMYKGFIQPRNCLCGFAVSALVACAWIRPLLIQNTYTST